MTQIPAESIPFIELLLTGGSAILGAFIGGKMSVRGARDAAELAMREQRDLFDENISRLDDAHNETVRKTASLVFSEMLGWIELSACLCNAHRQVPLPAIDFNVNYRNYLAELIPYMTTDQVKQCIYFYGNTKRLSLVIIDAQIADVYGADRKTVNLAENMLKDFYMDSEVETIRNMPYEQITQDALMSRIKQPSRKLLERLNSISGMNVFM